MSWPSWEALARIVFSSPSSTRSATPRARIDSAAARIRSSSPSGRTIVFFSPRARASSSNSNIIGVTTSLRVTSRAESSSSVGRCSATARRAASSFCALAALSRPRERAIRTAVSKVDSSEVMIGRSCCTPEMRRSTSSGTS